MISDEQLDKFIEIYKQETGKDPARAEAFTSALVRLVRALIEIDVQEKNEKF